MKNYLDILREVKENGRIKGNRTGVGTRYVFSEKFRHNMADGFPLLTTKKINPRQVLGELFGFLTGADTVQDFQKFGCNIWNSWGLSEDHYQVVQLPVEKYAEALAEVKGLTIEQATAAIKEVDDQNAAWVKEYQEQLQKIKNGEIATEDQEPMENLQAIMSEIMMRKPKPTVDWIAAEGVDVYLRDVIMAEGYLGPIYGKQWLAWKTSNGDVINQITRIAEQIQHHPMSRRIVLDAWNPEFIPKDSYAQFPNGRPTENSSDQVQCAILDNKQALPPCHMKVILDVDLDYEAGRGYVNMEVIMRSTDVPVGLPFNIASYAFLLQMIASQFGYEAGVLVIEMVNCHIYEDQLEGVETQLARTPGKLPTIKKIPMDIKFDDPSTLTLENLERCLECIEGYEPQGFIKYPVAV